MTISKRRYQAVTIDMGYTLVDIRGGYLRTILDFAQGAGLQIDEAQARSVIDNFWNNEAQSDAQLIWTPSEEIDRLQSWDTDRRICLALGITDPKIQEQASEAAQTLFRDPSNYCIFPEVHETLAALRSTGVALGILSNWGWYLPDLCDQLELTPKFDFVVVSARVGAAKPHPAIFQEALARAGATPETTLHVGDSLVADVHGARNAGMTGVLLDRSGSAARGATAAGDYPVITSLDQLLPLVTNGHNGR